MEQQLRVELAGITIDNAVKGQEEDKDEEKDDGDAEDED